MAEKIHEYLTTGALAKYKEVMAAVPEGLIDLLHIPNLGPKTVALANRELGVGNLADLKRVIADGSLAKLPSMGAKKIENIARASP